MIEKIIYKYNSIYINFAYLCGTLPRQKGPIADACERQRKVRATQSTVLLNMEDLREGIGNITENDRRGQPR